MSNLLESLLDPERRAAAQAADDAAVAAAREASRLAPPFWPFAPRTAAQLAIRHPRSTPPGPLMRLRTARAQ